MPPFAGRPAARRIAIAVSAAAVGMTGLALWDARDQDRILESRAMVAAQDVSIARGDPARPAPVTATADDPAPALVNLALIDARAAADPANLPRRTLLLNRASAAVTRARAARPGWGEAEVVAAYVAAERAGRSDIPDVLTPIAASYENAPLLRGGGAWRVTTGLANYARLSPGTRRRVVEEAVWLARIDNATRLEIFDRARASAAYGAVLTRWRDARRTDADMAAHDRPAP